MKNTFWFITLLIILFQEYSFSNNVNLETKATKFQVVELRLTSNEVYDWWEFPVSTVFTHCKTKTQVKVYGIWGGGKNYLIRFAPTLLGAWYYESYSDDLGLGHLKGTLEVSEPTQEQVGQNPNYRGFLQISKNGRYFEYADGTPFFLLATTNWAINTSRCGLGKNKEGPFYQYLNDGKSKHYTTILMSYLRGFGDVEGINGYRNEGGYPFINDDLNKLNPAYIEYLDQRIKSIWEYGFAHAVNTTWFGKRNCFFDIVWAKRISAYLTNRYSAYNGLISLSGEYQYAKKDCGWTDGQIEELGNLVQKYNPYHKPLSIHPSSRDDWPGPHNQQSSIAFHNSGWLDHNWLQSGQKLDQTYKVAVRTLQNYNNNPVKPVFLSEGYYEREQADEQAYIARWQAWVALLNGACGYGYGAAGIWQFYDPADPYGEPGKTGQDPLPWQDAIQYKGSRQLGYIANLFKTIPWWKLEPHYDWLWVNGEKNKHPTKKNITPPHCAAKPGEVYVVYIPRGNKDAAIKLLNLGHNVYSASWINTREAQYTPIKDLITTNNSWILPQRPEPSDEDWVLKLEKYTK